MCARFKLIIIGFFAVSRAPFAGDEKNAGATLSHFIQL
jgi:hypothetical protein